ncbi:MAG: hypothetical protein ABWX94_03210 [Candidatus Saccharimonadales bacterium]
MYKIRNRLGETLEKSRQTIGDQKAALIKELYTLRKGSGLTPWKLDNAVILRAITIEQTGIADNALLASHIQAFLHHEISGLRESIETRALRNAFAIGLEHNPQKLTARRNAFARTLNRHADTIEAYENRGIEQLTNQLMSLENPLYLARRSSPRDDRNAPSSDFTTTSEYQASDLPIARNMVTQGLSDMYGLGARAPEIHKIFRQSESPYLDTSVEWLMIPSARGEDWYTYKLRYTFRMQKERFRIGVSNSVHDLEILIASGVVDDTLKLNGVENLDTEIPGIIQNCGFMAYNEKKGTRTPLSLKELDADERTKLFEGIWQVDPKSCRILEVELSTNVGRPSAYEYHWSFDMPIDGEHYVYWSAPGLMYLSNLRIDISRFPGRDTWQFSIVPFLGTLPQGSLETNGSSYSVSAGGWIMQGHGVAITWQRPKSATPR